MATDSKKAIQLWFLISVSLLHLSSPSWARTNNPSVNSRMLYHWAIEEYLRNLSLTIVTIAQSFSKNKYFAENNYKKPPDLSDGLSDIPSKPHTLHIYHSILWTQPFRSSPRPISNSQLHALRHFHPCPIYLVVFKGSYFFRMGYLILRGASRLDAFSVYPFPTWLPGREPGGSTGTPEVSPSRSSRTKDSSSQISNAHAG